MNNPFAISFVCTGNICRSPMGEVIFRELAERAGLAAHFAVSSRGTHGWHENNPADPRTVTALADAGFHGDAHRAHQLTSDDVQRNDLLIALDRGHESILLERGASRDRVVLLSAFDPDSPKDPDVLDPYYSDDQAFTAVCEQIERSCQVLLEQLQQRI